MHDDIEIPEIAPTDAQSRAIAEIKDWYINRSKEQQIFRLFGYAGTGKTTITKYAIADLGLSMFSPPKRKRRDNFKNLPENFDIQQYMEDLRAARQSIVPDVFFAAFTGKASLVMRRHGTPAQTIHSMIMNVSEFTDLEIEQAEKRLQELMDDCNEKTGDEKILAVAAATAYMRIVEKMKEPGFSPDPFADVGLSKLIVLDEVSMVDEELAGYILSFGIPILVIGDPGQLPPIKGEGAFTSQAPDIMLEEIHRQAWDSPIIRLATLARNGQRIPYGAHGDTVWKMNKQQIGIEHFLRADQVICGLNATRYQLNAAMRNCLGFHQHGVRPTGIQLPDVRGNLAYEKIICLKNNHTIGLINGMFLTLEEPRHINEQSFDAIATTEDGENVGRLSLYDGYYRNHYDFQKDRESREWKTRRRTEQTTYGWAITCHKAQGSQWRNIIVYNDGWGRGSDQVRKWLYTGITRAEEGLVIVE